MSGDRLAQFQQNIDHANERGELVVVIGVDFAQRMVEIAKAADYVIEADGNLDQLARAIHLLRRKRAALARLDRSSSDGTADSGAAEGD